MSSKSISITGYSITVIHFLDEIINDCISSNVDIIKIKLLKPPQKRIPETILINSPIAKNTKRQNEFIHWLQKHNLLTKRLRNIQSQPMCISKNTYNLYLKSILEKAVNKALQHNITIQIQPHAEQHEHIAKKFIKEVNRDQNTAVIFAYPDRLGHLT